MSVTGTAVDGTVVAAIGGVAGLLWGLASDRVAARGDREPGEETTEAPGGEDPRDAAVEPIARPRPVAWRTLVAAAVGGAAGAGVAARYGETTSELFLFGTFAASLVLLLAIDLDRRLLPDRLTLPWIAVGLGAGIVGLNPLVAGALPGAVAISLGAPAALLLLSIPFGRGAIGIGDLKLLVGVGLVAGLERTVVGLLVGVLLAGLVVGALLVARRIDLRTFVPYGPFLIVGALWAVLLP